MERLKILSNSLQNEITNKNTRREVSKIHTNMIACLVDHQARKSGLTFEDFQTAG